MKNYEQRMKGREGANVEKSFVEERKDFGGGRMLLWRRQNAGIGRDGEEQGGKWDIKL